MRHGLFWIVCVAGLTFLLGRPAFADADLQSILAPSPLVVANITLDQDDLNAFYAVRKYKPVWSFGGPENAKTFSAFLKSVSDVIDYHGLNVDDFPLDTMRKLSADSDEDSKIKLELMITDTLIGLAHDLHGDGDQLDDLYVGWAFQRRPVDIPVLLSMAVTNNSLSEYITGLLPHNPAYGQLTSALQRYKSFAMKGGWQPIPAGPTLRLNDRSPRVAALRQRLVAENAITSDDSSDDVNIYTPKLAAAVALWQVHNGLNGDGNLGAKTVDALNIPVSTRIDQIRANLERWRHMPDDFPPDRYVMVNIANASIDIIEGTKAVYRGPVIVGRVDRKTPFIQSNVRSMIINPFWHVPAKIALKDILPKLRKDPHYLEKLGFVISGNSTDPHGDAIRWDSIPEREFNFRLRQSPGDMNSLGRLKFDFDNDFAVYMHGTPHQELFKKVQRDFSSGCVRLRDPEQIAEILMADNKGDWSVQKIEDEIATDKTRWVGLTKPIPIYILYWTVFVDETGNLNFRNDVYNYDGMLTGDPTALREFQDKF